MTCVLYSETLKKYIYSLKILSESRVRHSLSLYGKGQLGHSAIITTFVFYRKKVIQVSRQEGG